MLAAGRHGNATEAVGGRCPGLHLPLPCCCLAAGPPSRLIARARHPWCHPPTTTRTFSKITNKGRNNCGEIYGFYNNWFATRVGWWLTPPVQRFLQYVDESGVCAGGLSKTNRRYVGGGAQAS